MQYGFIGLGALGGRLAANLLEAGISLVLHDLDKRRFRKLRKFAARGARALWGESPRSVAEQAEEGLITCLPSPRAARDAMLAEDRGALAGLGARKVWIEMSTNDPHTLREIADIAAGRGIDTLAVPATGGVHRATAGNITLLIGGKKSLWKRHHRAFSAMGGEQIYIGSLEQAAQLKAITNMLAFIHLASAGEALALAQSAAIDLKTAFQAIKASSGNSFVFETEGQVILNGSYHIDFTMDLALKDLGFVQAMARESHIPLHLGSLVEQLFRRGRAKYGGQAQSPRIVQLLEEELGISLRAAGFPKRLPPELSP